MINTISKTLEAQEKTQDIKQSPSTKIKTKPDLRIAKKQMKKGLGRDDRKLPRRHRTRPIVARATALIDAMTGR